MIVRKFCQQATNEACRVWEERQVLETIFVTVEGQRSMLIVYYGIPAIFVTVMMIYE